MRRQAWLGLSLALLTAACGKLDSPDRVHDLRLLAMRADPPEQLLPIALAPDGGAGIPGGGARPDGGSRGFGGSAPDGGLGGAGAGGFGIIRPLTVTGLVADPQGAGRPVHYAFSTCAQLDANTDHCTDGSPGYQALAEDDLHPQGASGEVSVTFTPSFGLLIEAQKRDPYHGFGGLPLPVQLHIHAGDEDVFGFKRVVFSSLAPGQPPEPANQNPVIASIDFAGASWTETAEPGANPSKDGFRVSPAPDAAVEEAYDRPTFEGGSIHFKESWRYNYFATAGSFSPASTGGTNNLTGASSPIDSTWHPPTSGGAQDVTFWVVVRDGRGGESWVTRKARFQP